MLDILAELLIELFQGKDAKKKEQQGGQKKAPPPPPVKKTSGHLFDDWPEVSADDPYIKDHPSDLAASGEMSIEDLLRQMHEKAQQGGADAPVLVPGFDQPPPPARPAPPPRPRQSTRRQPRAVRPAAPAPAPVPTPAPVAKTYAPPPVRSVAPTPAVAAPQKASASAYAAKLRGNPQAARDAFVFSEIFGRPLGERR